MPTALPLSSEARTTHFAPETEVMTIDSARFADPDVIEDIVALLPDHARLRFDARLVVTECLANILEHGPYMTLTVTVRPTPDGAHLTLTHEPPLPAALRLLLTRCVHDMKAALAAAEANGDGLGLPLIVRLCRHVALSADNASLECHLAVSSA